MAYNDYGRASRGLLTERQERVIMALHRLPGSYIERIKSGVLMVRPPKVKNGRRGPANLTCPQSALSVLVRKGLMTRVETGVYKLTEEGCRVAEGLLNGYNKGIRP